MSITHSLVCTTCREKIWIGQKDYIYAAEPRCLAVLKEFLFRHKTDPGEVQHELKFITNDWNDFQYEYKEAKW